MKLINTSTLEIETFPGIIPPYAILSHTWGADGDEITLQEMIAKPRALEMKVKLGYKKIEKTCEIARGEYKLSYAWVDTCCIDKTSSAELSEAINSMYRWYRDSAVCLAYLSDMTANIQTFNTSRWFTRGWTLQELIAPRKVSFFDQTWEQRGSRWSFKEEIQAVTGVPITELFETSFDPSPFPVGVRMSWAASRETTREEDLAYCLMGIFDVNMPMLYGEGGKAFLRLQEEILRQNPDLSLFAWTFPHTYAGLEHSGLLAPSVACFRDVGDLRPVEDWRPKQPRISLNTQGITVFAPSLLFKDIVGRLFLPLGYYHRAHTLESGDVREVGILVRGCDSILYVRAYPYLLAEEDGSLSHYGYDQTLVLPRLLSEVQCRAISARLLRIGNFPIQRYEVKAAYPEPCWDPSSSNLYAGYFGPFRALLRFGNGPLHEGALPGNYAFAVICIYFAQEWRFIVVSGKEWERIIGTKAMDLASVDAYLHRKSFAYRSPVERLQIHLSCCETGVEPQGEGNKDRLRWGHHYAIKLQRRGRNGPNVIGFKVFADMGDTFQVLETKLESSDQETEDEDSELDRFIIRGETLRAELA